LEVYVRKRLSPTPEEAWRLMGRIAADADGEHIYKTMIMKGDPVAILRAYVALWPMHYTRGRMEVESKTTGLRSPRTIFPLPSWDGAS
jgi:hypothetical protein